MEPSSASNTQGSTSAGPKHTPRRVADGLLSSHTTRIAPQDDRKGLSWLVLLPIACCGGPPLIAGIAVVGAAAAGLGVGVAVIAIAVTLVVVRRRRAARCCTPANSAAEGPTGLDTSVLDEKRGPSR